MKCYYFDMDGVLAEYDRKGYEGDNPQYLQKGTHYFKNRQPDTRAIMAVIIMLRNMKKQGAGYALKVISRMPPDEDLFLEDVADKAWWLKTFVPGLDTEAHFIATKCMKNDIVSAIKHGKIGNLSKFDILVDDYNPNLIAWRDAGGTAVKWLNGINSPDSWDGPYISQDMDPNRIVECLENIV